jgi:hypothetical protein
MTSTTVQTTNLVITESSTERVMKRMMERIDEEMDDIQTSEVRTNENDDGIILLNYILIY